MADSFHRLDDFIITAVARYLFYPLHLSPLELFTPLSSLVRYLCIYYFTSPSRCRWRQCEIVDFYIVPYRGCDTEWLVRNRNWEEFSMLKFIKPWQIGKMRISGIGFQRKKAPKDAAIANYCHFESCHSAVGHPRRRDCGCSSEHQRLLCLNYGYKPQGFASAAESFYYIPLPDLK